MVSSCPRFRGQPDRSFKIVAETGFFRFGVDYANKVRGYMTDILKAKHEKKKE